MIGAMVEPKLTLITTQLSFTAGGLARIAAAEFQRGASLIVQFLRGVVERRMSPKSNIDRPHSASHNSPARPRARVPRRSSC